MRILWLSHLIPYPPKAGVLLRAHHLLRELARAHDVHLLAFHQKELMAPLFPVADEGVAEVRSALGELCAELAFFEIPSDVAALGRPRLALRSLFGAPYNIRWLFSPAFRRAVAEWSARIRPDVVHFDTISLAPYLGQVGDASAVLNHHNVESHMLDRRSRIEANPLKAAYFWQEGRRLLRWERRFCPRFDLNLTCSDLDAERLASLCPGAAIEVIPNPVDVDYFQPDASRPQDPKRLIFVGTLSWYPNREAVLMIAREIWPRLKERVPGVRFDVAGAHPPPELLELARRDPDFHVHGFVDDLRPLLDAAAVYVCPIRDGGGTRLKILDAFAMEKAVVAHPVACEGIEVQDGRNVTLARTSEENVEAVAHLLADPSQRRAQGRAARDLAVERYSTTAVGPHLRELYEQCARRERSAA